MISADISMQIFLYVLLVIFIVLFTIVSCKWQDEVHRNMALQDENSDLIDRNNKLDKFLDEARSVRLKKVYFVIGKSGNVFGCFSSKPAAANYKNNSPELMIKKFEIKY